MELSTRKLTIECLLFIRGDNDLATMRPNRRRRSRACLIRLARAACDIGFWIRSMPGSGLPLSTPAKCVRKSVSSSTISMVSASSEPATGI